MATKKPVPTKSEEAPDTGFFVPYHRLSQYDEFASFSHPQKNEIIDFIQWAYNRNSPLLADFESIEERRFAAARRACGGDVPHNSLLNFLTHIDQNGMSIVDVDTAVILTAIDDMILCYMCRIQNDNLFNAYVTLQRLFWQYQKTLLEPISAVIGDDKVVKATETKTKITPAYLELIERIDALRDKIFGREERIAKKAAERIRKPNAEARAI